MQNASLLNEGKFPFQPHILAFNSSFNIDLFVSTSHIFSLVKC